MGSTLLRIGILLCGLLGGLPITTHAQMQEGDRAWALRAETSVEERARPDQIETAIRAYRATLESDGDSIAAAWKLLRAYHYAIDFTTLDEEGQEVHLDQAIALVETSLARFDIGEANKAATPSAAADQARLYFWSAIAWGARAQRVGLLTIVREGVATRMHDYAERALALDPSVDRGGPLRLLSRLHATLPRVPFVSGWVDRDYALPLAEQAFALDPAHPGNRLVLALALLEAPAQGGSDREAEAMDLLRGISDMPPRTEALVEDLAVRRQAAEELSARVGPES